MKLTDITPKNFNCGIGACPAIFETADGDYVLIGKKVSRTATVTALDGRIGRGEIAVKIPRELLANLSAK